VSARQKRWKIFSRSCGWDALAVIDHRDLPEVAARSTSTASSIGLSGGVKRIALPIRLVITWRILSPSASTIGPASGNGSETARGVGGDPGRRRRSRDSAPVSEIVPVVGDRCEGRGGLRGRRCRDPGGPGRIVGAVEALRHDHRDHSERIRRGGIERGILGDRQQVDRLEAQRLRLVEAGELEQILDQSAHADRLALDPVHRLRHIVGAGDRAHPVQLGVPRTRPAACAARGWRRRRSGASARRFSGGRRTPCRCGPAWC
jgi:hypothetical protein